MNNQALNESLIKAIKENDEAKVLDLIKTDADVNYKYEIFELTPLIVAIHAGNPKIVQILLDNGADITIEDAAGRDVLSMTNNIELGKIFVEKGFNVKNISSRKTNALHWVSNLEYARFLIDQGIDLNQRDSMGESPIFRIEKWEIIELLLDGGANANIQNREGNTILHEALINKKKDVAKIILNYDIDVSVKNNKGLTCLHYAAVFGVKEVVLLLIEKGANINETTTDLNLTPLYIAAKNNKPEIVELLLNHNADKSVKSKKGFTALDAAKKAGEDSIINMLQ